MSETQLFVEYFYSTYGGNRSGERKISSKRNLSFPDNTFAYRFFERDVIIRNGEEISSKVKNVSGVRFFGEMYTLEEVKTFFGQYKALIERMEKKKWTQVVRTENNTWLPFREEDILMPKL